MKRVIIAEIQPTEHGVKINAATVLCLDMIEEVVIGKDLEDLGFKRHNREKLVKECSKLLNLPMYLARSE